MRERHVAAADAVGLAEIPDLAVHQDLGLAQRIVDDLDGADQAKRGDYYLTLTGTSARVVSDGCTG